MFLSEILVFKQFNTHKILKLLRFPEILEKEIAFGWLLSFSRLI